VSALAHGEQVILFPVGTVLAVAVLLLLARVWASKWPARLAACTFALAAAIPPWVMPGDELPAQIQRTGWGYFLLGFAPSMLIGAAALRVVRAIKP